MPPRHKAAKSSLELVIFPVETSDSCPPDEPKGFRSINNQLDKTIESAQEYRECRICLENETINSNMISACRCLGSVRFVHEECLKEWIQRSLISDKKPLSVQCEICKCPFQYETIRIRKCDQMAEIQKKISEKIKIFIFLLVLLITSFSTTIYLIVLFVLTLQRSTKAEEIGIVGLGLGLLIIIDGILMTVFVSDFGYSVKWIVGKVKENVETTINEEEGEEEKRKSGKNKQNSSHSNLVEMTMSPLQYSRNQIVPF